MDTAEFRQLGYGKYFHLSLATFLPGSVEQEDGSESPNLVAFTDFDPGQWMDAAVSAGATYMLFTAKHGGGFAWWPSASNPHNVTASSWYHGPQGVNVLQAVISAARGRNLKVIIYFSLKDGAYVTRSGSSGAANAGYTDYVKTQLTEILHGEYGPIDGIFFDAPNSATSGGNPDFTVFRRTEIYDHVKSLQANCLVGANWEFNSTPFPVGDWSIEGIDWGANEVSLTGQVPANEIIPAENAMTPWTTWFWHSDVDYTNAGIGNGLEQAANRAMELRRDSIRNGYNATLNFPPSSSGKLTTDFLSVLNLLTIRKKTPARWADDFRLYALESAGQTLQTHTSKYTNLGMWQKRVAGNSDLIIQADATARGNGTNAGTYIFLEHPDAIADYGAQVTFGFHTAPTDSYTAVQLRTGYSVTPSYSAFWYHHDSGSQAQLGIRDTDGTPIFCDPYTVDWTKTYRLEASIHGQILRARLFECDLTNPTGYMVRTIERTMVGGLTAAGNAGLEYAATPNGNSTGMYLMGYELFYEDFSDLAVGRRRDMPIILGVSVFG